MYYLLQEFWHGFPVKVLGTPEFLSINHTVRITVLEKSVFQSTIDNVRKKVDMGGGWDELGGWNWHIYPTVCKTHSGKLLCHTGSSFWCLDDLEGWDGGKGRRSQREGIYVHILLIHFVLQQKLTKHCKAVIICCLIAKSYPTHLRPHGL